MTVLVVAVLLWFVGYLGHCAWRPWRECRKCKGRPRNYDSKGWRTFNDSCLWCSSSGRKRRWGSLLLGRGYGRL